MPSNINGAAIGGSALPASIASKAALPSSTGMSGPAVPDVVNSGLPNVLISFFPEATIVATVHMSPLPTGAEVVMTLVGDAYEFDKITLWVIATGISVVVVAHSSSIIVAPGVAL